MIGFDFAMRGSWDALIGCSGTRNAALSGSAWPSANLGIFVPIRLLSPVTVRRMWYIPTGTTGNVDLGIYTTSGALIVSTGAQAVGSASTVVFVSVTATVLGPGDYFLGMSASATNAYARGTPVACRALGIAQMASAHPLPSTATFAAPGQEYLPIFGFSSLTADL